MGGQPCIRGLRMPVATVVAMVADRMTTEEILGDFPELEAEDVAEALRYAAEAARERQLPLQQPAEVPGRPNLSRKVAAALRAAGHDVVHTSEVELSTAAIVVLKDERVRIRRLPLR